MAKEQKTIIYKNELEDEFSKAVIEAKRIDDGYSYLGGIWRKIGRAILYYGLARPLGGVFIKLKYGHRIENKEVLKQAKGRGYFLYGNHTNAGADPFIPQFVDINRDLYVIVHPANVSMPVLGRITPSLGALPLPDTLGAARNFNRAIDELISKSKTVLIYPEAHIWPYYTKIRPFTSASFGYAVQCNAPVYCFTNTYQKRRFIKTPRMVTYVDGPFFCDSSLSRKEQKEMLRNKVYEAMCNRAKLSNVEVIRYVKGESND